MNDIDEFLLVTLGLFFGIYGAHARPDLPRTNLVGACQGTGAVGDWSAVSGRFRSLVGAASAGSRG